MKTLHSLIIAAALSVAGSCFAEGHSLKITVGPVVPPPSSAFNCFGATPVIGAGSAGIRRIKLPVVRLPKLRMIELADKNTFFPRPVGPKQPW